MITNGNSEFQRSKIERLGLAQFFDCILIEGEFGVGKPDPSIFLHALHSIEVNARETWMLGDHLWYDIAPARNLGMTAIWIDMRLKGLPENAPVRPDRIIRDMSELLP